MCLCYKWLLSINLPLKHQLYSNPIYMCSKVAKYHKVLPKYVSLFTSSVLYLLYCSKEFTFILNNLTYSCE